MRQNPRQARLVAIALASALLATACAAVQPAHGPAPGFGILTIATDALVGSDRAAEVYILGLPVGVRHAPALGTAPDPAGPQIAISRRCHETRMGCDGSRPAETSAP